MRPQGQVSLLVNYLEKKQAHQMNEDSNKIQVTDSRERKIREASEEKNINN